MGDSSAFPWGMFCCTWRTNTVGQLEDARAVLCSHSPNESDPDRTWSCREGAHDLRVTERNSPVHSHHVVSGSYAGSVCSPA